MAILTLGLTVASAPACAPKPRSSEALRVLAAASCAPLGPAWSEAWEQSGADAPLQFQWGSSSALARQILDGAPADVWISAHERWVEELRKADRILGEPVEIARGRLVVIAPADAQWAANAHSWTSLWEHWPAGSRFAIGGATVPVGQYGRQAWERALLPDSASAAWVTFPDARAVLRAVVSGEATAGLVYRSDAVSAQARVLFEIPSEHHDPIRYWACGLRTSQHPEAVQSYLEFLGSPEARMLRQRFAFD